MATLDRLLVHPIKSLDPVSVQSATIVENGGLDLDRRYAIVERAERSTLETDPHQAYVNGKRERRIHRLTAEYHLSDETVTLSEYDSKDERRFHLERDRDRLAAWLSEFVGYPVDVVRDDEGGYPDDMDDAGPTLLSQGTLEAVASWYDGIDATEMCRRLRPNLVVAGVPAFWEDRLYDRPDTVVPFEIGAATFHGVNPCQRCVVPSRDPNTGVETDGFRETFVRRREATLPDWASEAWFDHYFRLMVNTRVPESSWQTTLATGDTVGAVGEAQPTE